MALQNYQSLLAIASQTLNALTPGTQFVLKDLFKGAAWANVPKGDKLGMGRFFKHEVVTGNIPDVIYIRKADNNSSIYQKI